MSRLREENIKNLKNSNSVARIIPPMNLNALDLQNNSRNIYATHEKPIEMMGLSQLEVSLNRKNSRNTLQNQAVTQDEIMARQDMRIVEGEALSSIHFVRDTSTH